MGGSIGQAQTGFLKSIPKLTKINGDDNLKVIYRNLGNNHAYPFIWGDEFVVASGITEVVLASGVNFHGYDLATYANVTVTPCYDAGAVYVTKDPVTNIISCTVEKAGGADSKLDVKFMLGMDPIIEGIQCRGNTGAMPTYP